MEIHPPHAAAHSFKDFAIQLSTIAAGVLIALSFEGVREWNHYRTLVNEARENIGREMADNRREVESVLRRAGERKKNLASAIRLADELLAKKQPTVNEINLGFEIADVSAASWLTADRTGALAHMDYAEVQRYARLYGHQDLYTERQRVSVEQLRLAMGILQADPTDATPKDLEIFRQRVIELGASVQIEDQLGEKLVDEYQELQSARRQ